MAGVKGITQFYLPSTRLSTNGINHSAFIPQPQSITARLAGTYFPSHRGQEAELAWVADYIPRWYARLKTVTHPSTNRPVVQRPKIELRTIHSQVRRPNHQTTEPFNLLTQPT